MAENDLQVIVKAKELAKHSFQLTSNCDRYPKKFRHSLCDRIQLKSLDIYESLMEANRINNVTHKAQRCEMITRGITYCDELLFFIELSMGMGLLNDKSAAHWSKLASDVKYMALAWRKRERQGGPSGRPVPTMETD